MKPTKLLKIALIAILVCVMGLFVSCAVSQENANDSALLETDGTQGIFLNRENSFERVLTNEKTPTVIESIPNSQITLSATATKTATARWFLSYLNNGLSVKVYVEDPVIYKINGVLEYNDYIEVMLSNTDYLNNSGWISVIVNAYGEYVVKNLENGEEVKNSNLAVSVYEFALNGEKSSGWVAEITIPYALAGISETDKNASVCLGMSNADSKLLWQTVYHEGVKTDSKKQNTYAWLANDNQLEQNPSLYSVIDGITLDGTRDAIYGEFTDTVTLSGGKWYDISAVKTQNGVFVYTRAAFSSSYVDQQGTGWGRSTDFEFKLNRGETSYVNIEGGFYGVTDYVLTVKLNERGLYLHTLEMFIASDLILGWDNDESVQINYGWKSPTEKAFVLSDMLHVEHCGWNTDWHAYQRLGGLSTSFVDLPANLMISESGLKVVTAPKNGPVIDGDLSEYATPSIVKGSSSKAVVGVSGKVLNGNLYLAFEITHGEWSGYNTTWWQNDNLEMIINNERFAIMFYNGKLIIPEAVDQGASITKKQSNGKNVTTVELFIAGNSDVYRVSLGMNGVGFGGWQSLVWDNSACFYVDCDGASLSAPVKIGNTVLLDGVCDDAVWTDSVKNNAITTTANGATVTTIGKRISGGVVLATTITHTKAPNESINGQTNWWNYLNIEYVLNYSENQFITTARSEHSKGIFTSCKTELGENGVYTTVFESYVADCEFGATAYQKSVPVAFGGWLESAFAWLFGGNRTIATHYITENGISDKNITDDGILKILTVGNSFSDDTMEYVGLIAESYGMQVYLGNLYIGGCSVETHANNLKNDAPAYQYRTYVNGAWKTQNNYKLADAVKSQNWDYISFQQASPDSGRESSLSSLDSLISGVKNIANSDVTFIWHMTWAYQQNSTHSGFAIYNNDQTTMYNAIVNVAKDYISQKQEIAFVAPVGTAIQNARTSILGDRLTREGYHLDYYYGRYIAGLTFFGKITGADLSKVKFAPANVNVEIKAICIEAAQNALKTPYEVTQSELL